MLIFPAIDLQDGCVVRFVQGSKNKKIYSRDPVKVAKHWLKQGAQALHVVDLDGAFTGEQKNLSVVKEIIKNINIPVQFGGGIRTTEAISGAFSAGVWRVILGTKAVNDAVFLKETFNKFGDKIIVGLDAKDDFVMIKGWKDAGEVNVLDFARSLKDVGFKEIIYTDTLKDGTLTGPNIKGIKSLLKDSGLKIVASGGVSSLDDIFKLKKLENDGVSGVIVGKALYEGKFTLGEALKLV